MAGLVLNKRQFLTNRNRRSAVTRIRTTANLYSITAEINQDLLRIELIILMKSIQFLHTCIFLL